MTSAHLKTASPLFQIADKKLDSELRVTAALEYLMQHPEAKVDKAAFEDHCGVGIVVTPEMIEAEVEKAVAKVKSDILAKRYRYPVGQLMGDVRKGLKWADGKAIKNEIDVQILDLLGPKTEADLAPVPKVKAEKKSNADKGGGGKKAEKASSSNGPAASGKRRVSEPLFIFMMSI